MKNIITVIICFLGAVTHAQIGFEKQTVDGSGIIDFPTGTTKGILLPIVDDLSLSTENGTLLMSKIDSKIKFRANDIWVDLSDEGDCSDVVFSTTDDQGLQGVIIGQNNTVANGVLILESQNQALILPKIISPQINVKSPIAGMICYDTVSKSLAVFNGLQWTFWK